MKMKLVSYNKLFSHPKLVAWLSLPGALRPYGWPSSKPAAELVMTRRSASLRSYVYGTRNGRTLQFFDRGQNYVIVT